MLRTIGGGYPRSCSRARRGSRASRVNQRNAKTRQSTTPTAYARILWVFTVVFRSHENPNSPQAALETIAAPQRRAAHRLVHEKYSNQRPTAQSAIVSVKRSPQGSASPRNNFSSGIACVERIAPLHTEQQLDAIKRTQPKRWVRGRAVPHQAEADQRPRNASSAA